jgi:hypothetical protein
MGNTRHGMFHYYLALSLKGIKDKFFPEDNFRLRDDIINPDDQTQEFVIKIIKTTPYQRKKYHFWGEMIEVEKTETILEVRQSSSANDFWFQERFSILFSPEIDTKTKGEIVDLLLQ